MLSVVYEECVQFLKRRRSYRRYTLKSVSVLSKKRAVLELSVTVFLDLEKALEQRPRLNLRQARAS